MQENELYRFCACFCFDGTLWQRLRMLHSDGTLCSAVAQGQTLYAPEHDANVIERKDGVRPAQNSSVQTVAAICMSLAVSALSMDSCFVAIST